MRSDGTGSDIKMPRQHSWWGPLCPHSSWPHPGLSLPGLCPEPVSGPGNHLLISLPDSLSQRLPGLTVDKRPFFLKCRRENLSLAAPMLLAWLDPATYRLPDTQDI